MKSCIEKLLPIISVIILALGLFKIMDSGIALSIAVIIGEVSTILNGYSKSCSCIILYKASI